MKYKLLVLDLDGTLTNSRKEITPHTLNTLIEAQKRGIRLVLASGRPTYGIVPIANKLKMADFGGYILAFNGGRIIDWSSKKVICETTLDPNIIPYFYKCAKDNGFAIVTYKDQYVLTENPDDEYVQKEAILNVMTTKHVEHFPSAITFPIAKCLIVGEPTRLAALEQEMRCKLINSNEVYRSEPYFLELVPKGIDKALSLSHLLDKIGIDSNEMIACGDGFNDLSMIRYAGLGIAMANAQQPVREAADYITLSNDEDGVAAVVEKFMM